MKADAICEALSSLSQPDLEVVYLRVQLLRSTSTLDFKTTGSTEEAKLYNSLHETVQKATGSAAGAPYHQFTRTTFYPSFHAGYEHVSKLTSAWFPNATKPERYSLYSLYASLIVARVQERLSNRRWLWRHIIAQLNHLEDVVEDAFPGYYASGLMTMILNARTKERDTHARPEPDTET